MILRRLAEAIREQNWFNVILELLIVTFGVYIGIYLGEIADERARTSQVRDSLQVVRLQLEQDLLSLDEIVEYRTKKLEQPARLIPVLDQKEFDRRAFSQDLESAFSRMFTFFPRSSGYSTMKDRGDLASLTDPRLQEVLAHLYDSVYVRHVVNSEESDQNTFFYVRNVVVPYWNMENAEFVGSEDVARARLQNALHRTITYSEWYVVFLRETVRPAIVEAIDAIDAYQERRAS